MANNKNDFVLDSKGLCFLCLDKIFPIKNEQEYTNRTFPKYPLHYLSRYLKMDMRKVFSDMEQIPPHLLAKVESSRLKVGLCEECVCLNEKFNWTYRKLEKLEIELGSCLERIHAKLLDASGTRRTEKLKTLADIQPKLNSCSDGELEILEALREEAFQKSNHKLRAVVPRVKFRNLTRKEIRAKTQKSKVIPNKHQEALLMSSNTDITSKSDLMASDGKIKLEAPDSLSADVDTCPSDDLNTHDDAMCDDFADTNMGMQDHNDMDYTGPRPSGVPTLVTKICLKSKSKSETERPTWRIIPETGRYKCDSCSMEFADKGAVQRHYKSVHLKVRFKCVTCGKQFINKSDCNRHQKSAHVGVRYACQVCKKSFTQSGTVRLHQRVTDCGKKLNVMSIPDKT